MEKQRGSGEALDELRPSISGARPLTAKTAFRAGANDQGATTCGGKRWHHDGGGGTTKSPDTAPPTRWGEGPYCDDGRPPQQTWPQPYPPPPNNTPPPGSTPPLPSQKAARNFPLFCRHIGAAVGEICCIDPYGAVSAVCRGMACAPNPAIRRCTTWGDWYQQSPCYSD